MDVSIQGVFIVDPRSIYLWEHQVWVTWVLHLANVWQLTVREDWLSERLIHSCCFKCVLRVMQQVHWLLVLVKVVY